MPQRTSTRLADRVEYVIGVDTHKATHTLAVVDRHGGEIRHATEQATPFGYRRMLKIAREHAPTSRCWAIESTGSFGRGLTTYLLEHGEFVAELDRPARPGRRNGAKTDEIDATRAAREALARPHLTQPRQRGDREALRVLLRTRQGAVDAKRIAVCHLKALLVTAPALLRQQLDRHSTDELLARCARLRTLQHASDEQRATLKALRSTARRALALTHEADDLESDIELLVKRMAPQLLAEPGIGTLTAAEILITWSHAGRVRNDSAFAMIAGAAPIPASSGQVTRHRLNRRGDRRLNCALHTIALSRMTYHQETKDYAEKRRMEGKSDREIRRCLKRYLARRIYKLLEATTPLQA
jgi:transposase